MNAVTITKQLQNALNSHKKDANALAKTLVGRNNKNDFLLGGALLLVKENNLQENEGYGRSREDFIALVEDVYGVKHAKAYRMMQIYTTLSQYEETLSIDTISLFNVTKQYLLAKYVTPENMQELVNDAKWMTGQELENKYGTKKEAQQNEEKEEVDNFNVVQFKAKQNNSITVEFTEDEAFMLNDVMSLHGATDLKQFLLDAVQNTALFTQQENKQPVFA